MPLVKKWQLDEHEDDPDAHHRKWGWADEQGWKRFIYLPYAYEKSWVDKGIVIEHGTGYESAIAKGGVLRLPDVLPDYPYLMYYTGDDAFDWLSARIFLQKSSDGITFTKSGVTNPILTAPTGYSSLANFCPIYDTWETDANKKYKAIASAYHTEDALWKPVVYYGSDYQTFAFEKAITLTAYNHNPSLIKMGNIYLIGYRDANNDLRLSVADEGFNNIYNYGVIVARGAAGEWDATRVLNPSLFFNLGSILCIYRGDDANNIMRLGMASTPAANPFRTWDKWPLNPVAEGAIATWRGVPWGDLLMLEDKFRMYCGDAVAGYVDISRFEIANY